VEGGINRKGFAHGADTPVSLWWLRRDLRLSDNQALNAALERGRVIPVFIMDEKLIQKPAEKRQAFLFAGLRALQEDLLRLGSGMIIRRGDPVLEIPRLAEEVGASTVYAEADITPYALRRDAAVAQKVNLVLNGGPGAQPFTAVTRPDGKPYTVFTPYSRAWKSLPAPHGHLNAPEWLPATSEYNGFDSLIEKAHPDFPAGEREAQRRLAAFLDGPIFDYGDNRDQLDVDGTSSLSPYLHFGMLSARQAVAGARQVMEHSPENISGTGPEIWLNELIWRDFYQSILYHFPGVLHGALKPSWQNFPWRHAPQELLAWMHGLTGYPVVDAGMRQLAATGWMHNRARMITASFLVKHLMIDWREGERWFMQNLIDGDLASNNGGWQWVAGTGTDAAPYFRIFNPILQAKKFDQNGGYVRRWVPELTKVPSEWIHTPWQMPPEMQRETGVVIGRDYPAPMVDHAFARERALKAYQALR